MLHIPVCALQTGLLAVKRVDKVRLLLADVGEAGVVGGRVGGERPVVKVGHCEEELLSACYRSLKLNRRGRTDLTAAL